MNALSAVKSIALAPLFYLASKAQHWIPESFERAYSFAAGIARGWVGTSYEALVRAVNGNVYASRAMRLIAQTMASVPVLVYTVDEEGKEVEVARSPALDALRVFRWRRFCERVVWGLHCGGEWFVNVVRLKTGGSAGKVVEVDVLRNERFVRIERGEDDEPTFYVFRKRRGGLVRYPAEQILHVKAYNPLDDDRGLALLVAARRQFSLMERADEWSGDIAGNGGRAPVNLTPTGLQPGQMLPEETVSAEQDRLDRQHAKGRRTSPERVYSGAFAVNNAGVSPREANAIEWRAMGIREVAAITGVMATLIGDERQGSLTDAGVNSEVRALLMLTVLPLLDGVLEELTAFLLPAGEFFRYDRDQIEALQEDVNAIWTRVGKAVGDSLLTVNEARAVVNYPAAEPATDATPVADRLLSAFNRVPLDTLDAPQPAPGPAPEPADAALDPVKLLAGLADFELEAWLSRQLDDVPTPASASEPTTT